MILINKRSKPTTLQYKELTMDTGSRSPQIIEAFLAKRQILFQGDVDSEMQARITRLILYLNTIDDKQPITLLIDSCGGQTKLSLSICDAIEQSRAVVTGLVVADAFSAAFRILQSCHRRLAYPRARLQFHAPAIDGIRIDDDRWDQYITDLRGLNEEQLHVYAKRSKQSMRQLRKWSKEEEFFSAAKALKLGFIDELVRPPKK